MSPRWSSKPPSTSGRYLYRQRIAPAVEHECEVTVYSDGSREVIGDDDDTVDNLGEYEFKGPLSAAADA